MIKLSSKTYHLNVDQKNFWANLDAITFGQALNPELTYTTQFMGKFENTFAGRRKRNHFSIYLYQPLAAGWKMEVLAKGEVKNGSQGTQVKIDYEIPLWSILAFLIIAGFTLTTLWISDLFTTSVVCSLLVLFAYLLILQSNHKAIKSEVQKQFLNFQDRTERS